jgi:hypothetical protein
MRSKQDSWLLHRISEAAAIGSYGADLGYDKP